MTGDNELNLIKQWMDERHDDIMRRFDTFERRIDGLPCRQHSEIIQETKRFFERRKRIGAGAWTIILLIAGNVAAWFRVWIGSR